MTTIIIIIIISFAPFSRFYCYCLFVAKKATLCLLEASKMRKKKEEEEEAVKQNNINNKKKPTNFIELISNNETNINIKNNKEQTKQNINQQKQQPI